MTAQLNLTSTCHECFIKCFHFSKWQLALARQSLFFFLIGRRNSCMSALLNPKVQIQLSEEMRGGGKKLLEKSSSRVDLDV